MLPALFITDRTADAAPSRNLPSVCIVHVVVSGAALQCGKLCLGELRTFARRVVFSVVVPYVHAINVTLCIHVPACVCVTYFGCTSVDVRIVCHLLSLYYLFILLHTQQLELVGFVIR